MVDVRAGPQSCTLDWLYGCFIYKNSTRTSSKLDCREAKHKLVPQLVKASYFRFHASVDIASISFSNKFANEESSLIDL